MIDGDLCEQYNSLDPSKKKSIAEDLDRTPSEVSRALHSCYVHCINIFQVSKKLEDIRTRYAF